MKHNYLRYTLINPKLIKGKSAIHGHGIFAKEALNPGEGVLVFGGEPIPRKAAHSNDYRLRSVWSVGEGAYLAQPADAQESLEEYLNHSCAANTWLDNEVTISARRVIRVGEEITLDQGTWNDEREHYMTEQAHCSCGAPTCRKLLTKHDWEQASLRAEYRGHLHPNIQRRIW